MVSKLLGVETLLREYNITKYGFLPAQEPLKRLENPYYQPWELVISKLPELLSSRLLRDTVDCMPVLETTGLTSEEERRRAFVIFSFLSHAYIWNGKKPSERLPPCISVPFIAVSASLGLPPVATYAGLNLWDWTSNTPHPLLTLPEHLDVLHTFTGTTSERWFYLISVSMEALCAPTIPTLLHALSAASIDDYATVTYCLEELAICLRDLGSLFERMYERCDPHDFYHRIRPFLAGSKNMAKAGLPRGVFYDEGNGRGEWRRYSGGSNAQSAILQFFDVVLGVVHHPTRGSDDANKQKNEENEFIKEMRSYMPGPHRQFLEYLSTIPNLRTYINAHPDDSPLVEAYNEAVGLIRAFRDKHIKLVSRYIVAQSRMTRPRAREQFLNLASASGGAESGELCGTGGTTLMSFLKQARDETAKASC